MKRILLFFVVMLTIVGLIGSVSFAASSVYPEKPIKIVVPFSPGGSVDTTIRILKEVAEKLEGGFSFVIINKPGGGAVIGQTEVAHAKPDGYTLLAATSSVVTNTITKETTYTIDSFEPIIMYCFDPELVLVPGNSPFTTLKEVIESGKENPLINVTSGYSTSHHVAALIFSDMTGCQFDYLHPESGAQQILAIAGGHGEVGMSSYGPAGSLIKGGKIRMIAVASEERLPYIPEIPTFKEEGVDLIWGAFRGVAAPTGTPPEVIKILHNLFKLAMEQEEYQEKMTNAGFPIVYRSSEDFKKYIHNSYEAQKGMLLKLGD